VNLYYGNSPCASVAAAVPIFGRKEFQSPVRSTVPLLSWLTHEQASVAALLRDLGMPQDSDLHLEYRVSPPKGKGKASHTDLMAMSGDSSLAIEAKWTEQQYDTVGKWLQRGPSPQNRLDVLAGWLELLQSHARRPLHTGDFHGAVYQTVHRAASACASGHKPRMAYVLFEPSPDKYTAGIQTLRQDLEHLWGLLGKPSRFPMFVVGIPLCQTELFKALAPLPKGDHETARRVGATLVEGQQLFTFGDYHVTGIGE